MLRWAQAPPPAKKHKTFHDSLRKTLPEVVEVCKLQGGVAVREEFTVALVCHVTLHGLCGVERAALLVTP